MNSIDRITGNYERQAYVTDASKKQDAKEKQPSELQSRESDVKVSLSDVSKDLQLAEEAAASAPDENNRADRSDMVEQLTKEVDEGRYEADPAQVAEKIVGGVIDEIV
jgi:anti-sigma28 factor (negative regulator of flagellin synthesis)